MQTQNPINFEEFKDSCVEHFQQVQDEFIKLYDVNSYANWYYDHLIGVFTFNTGDKKLYFKYIDVGSFSNNTKTWKWSWDNKSTPEMVKKGMEKVKVFGETNNFTELTTGLIDGDEYTGWAMTAMTAKLLNGIGLYRAPSDHLEIYFVFTAELDQDQYEQQREKHIECEEHIAGKIAFVCQHLNTGKITGFHEAFPTDPENELEEDDLQAWCDECEKVRLQEGEWNEKSEACAKIKLICDQCYFEIKQHNLGHP